MLTVDRPLQGGPVTVHIECQGPRWPNGSRWSVGTSVGNDARLHQLLLPSQSIGPNVIVDPETVILVPSELAPTVAALVPLAVEALRVWDILHTEIGAAALITSEAPWSPILWEAARWYGAFPVSLGGQEEPDGAPGVDAVSRLAASLKQYGAISAVELTGRADMVDLLLEALPRYTRVLFAGAGRESLTIDYYMNVHRKGLHLTSTVLSPMTLFETRADQGVVNRASQLLMNRSRAAAFEAAVTDVCTVRPDA